MVFTIMSWERDVEIQQAPQKNNDDLEAAILDAQPEKPRRKRNLDWFHAGSQVKPADANCCSAENASA